MIRVEGHDLWRGGVKIGYIGDGRVIDHSGEKVGFYSTDEVRDKTGRKLAFISGDFIFFSDGSPKIRIEDIDKDVVGGSLSNIEKAAARVILGE